MVTKYRDVIRMTLFGRHDKNINDTTSIYQGYDRYATTTTGVLILFQSVIMEQLDLEQYQMFIFQMLQILIFQP